MLTLHRLLSAVAVASALAVSSAAHAQAAAKPAAAKPAAAAPASAPAQPVVVIDAEKQKLIDRVLVLLHPENAVVGMVRRPAGEALQNSNVALHQAHLTQEKIDKTMKDISADVKLYMDSALPIAVASAKKNSTPSLSPLLAQNFSSEELRQLIALLESPIKAKFEALSPQIERAIGEKVAGEVGPEINKQIATLNQNVGTKLRAATLAD
jgi:hypothetical protein